MIGMGRKVDWFIGRLGKVKIINLIVITEFEIRGSILIYVIWKHKQPDRTLSQFSIESDDRTAFIKFTQPKVLIYAIG
jgi:hypothetical protein